MKNKKIVKYTLVMLFCVLCNAMGNRIVTGLGLPLWLDCYGTVLAAYALGPIWGAMAGLAGNIITNFEYPIYCWYAIAGIVIGLIAGKAGRKGYFETIFGTMSAGVLITLTAVVSATPLNLILSDGYTGNTWGDGVIDFLREWGLPMPVCSAIGEFYLDFVDKVLTLILVFLTIVVFRRVRNMRRRQRENTSARVTAVFLLFCVGWLGVGNTLVAADEAEDKTAEEAAVDFNSYVRNVYSSDNGLPCGAANDIAQTQDGILWIGTYAGLYRYNGSEFRWMDEYQSVRNVNCLYVDDAGRLWIGTNDNGLSVCENEKLLAVMDEDKGLPSNSVRSIVQCSDGTYYIGTSGHLAVVSLEGDDIQLKHTISQVNYVKSISADKVGNVAAVTSAGELFIMSGQRIVLSEQLGNDRENYTCCSFAEDGLLYIGSSNSHIYVYDISSGSLQLKNTYSCGKLSLLNNIFFENGMLFACADNGIGYLDADGKYTDIETGEFNNSIDDMLVDYQGDYWFVSSRMGLLRLSASSFTNLYSTAAMKSVVVNSVTKWQDALYIGTDDGLDVLDEQAGKQITNQWTQLFADMRIRCVKTDSAGGLWVCTYGKGLIEITKDGQITTYDSTDGTFGDWVRVVFECSDGTIMSASDAGVAYIRDHKITKLIPYGNDWSTSMVMNLTELADGSILAGTDGDGIAVLEDGKVVRKLTKEDGLLSGVVLRTVPARDGKGVFVVTSNSLSYMDENFRIRSLNNFPYYNNYDVLEDENGQLFVFGSSGIYVVDQEELLSGRTNLQYDLLNAQSGLNSTLTVNAWNYCDSNGDLYLGCDAGVYKVNMASYLSGSRDYRIKLAKIRLDDRLCEVENDSQFVFERGIDRVEIIPEVINYTIEDPFVSYYLEGVDSKETVIPESELSSIVYTNLSPGSYTFHLTVLDNRRENVLNQITYTLVKEKAIYDNDWFKVYMLVVALLFASWLTWLIVRTQIQHTLNLQKAQLEFAQEQARMGNETILAIAKTVDAKDENTSQHSMRVSEYSVMIARELGFSKDECENLRKAALLHDIGKISIPDSILNKPARLTDDEYAIMKSHVTRGAAILKDFTLVEHVVEGAKYHHERYDGRGYAEGLKGEEIPLYGRIIGVADAFDAMTANRVYRKQLDFDYVLSELKKGRGTQFDPNMVDIMLRLIDEGKINVERLYAKSKGQNTETEEKKE